MNQPSNSPTDTFDFVIVGGGSAGSVLASRLSEDPNVKVCLLEAGGKGDSMIVRTPLLTALMIPKWSAINNWALKTTPQAGLNNRQGYQPRGKCLGGSSAINAMVYIRGHRDDYDRWAAKGATGWSFSFVEAGINAGYKQNDDFNGAEQEGVGLYQVTQRHDEKHRGERCSSYAAYLRDQRNSRPNLTIITGAKASKIVMTEGRASGVEFKIKGNTQTVKANKEVLVSSGAFGSPQLLMLSGIGPKEELNKHNIEIKAELPGVGKNLQDHLDYVHTYAGTRATTKNTLGIAIGMGPKLVPEILKYRKNGSGMLTTNIAEGGAFLKSNPDEKIPDIQLHFVVSKADDHLNKVHYGYGYSCHVCVLRPTSVGDVTLSSTNPADSPLIDPAFLDTEDDATRLLKGANITREILNTDPLGKFRNKELYTEGMTDDGQMMDMIRKRGDTIYHPIGTCKMGTDEMAVVDPELRVKGVEGLRVVDASVMPDLIGGNTNAPTMVIAEKAALMIQSDWKLQAHD